MTAPPALPALIVLAEFLALPITVLAGIALRDWWTRRHPNTDDKEPRP